MNDMNNCRDELARQKLQDHEKTCAERYEQFLKGLEHIENQLGGLSNRFWALAVGLITVLLTVIGALIGYLAYLLRLNV